MQGRQTGTIRHHVRYYLKSILVNDCDDLVYSGEVIQHILYPCCNGKSRLAFISCRIFSFGQPQQIGDQSILNHSVSPGYYKSGSHHTAIFRDPFQGVFSRLSISFHTSGKHPKITMHICLPVHRPTGCHHSICSRINNSCAHNYNFQLRVYDKLLLYQINKIPFMFYIYTDIE